MAAVISNEMITDGIGLMEVESGSGGIPGQFYMLKAWKADPLLSRPISIFDADSGRLRFLYQVVGEGTRRFASLRPGDELNLEGPFGNGFPKATGSLALVGGGIGIAPLYYMAKTAGVRPDVFLGFSKEPYLTEEFKKVSGKIKVDVGGTILDSISFEDYDTVVVCGPHGMLKAAQKKQGINGRRRHVYVSLENRMACGIGACLVCSVRCKDGMKKACTDGPVFPVEEVVFHD